MVNQPLADPHHYSALSPGNLWRYGSRREQLWLLGGWLLLTGICIGLGVGMVVWQWSGIPVNIGGVTAYVTVYPPLLICMLLTLTCGWWWGAIPAYLATFSLALYSGMPLPWALLFACANPLGFAIMTIGYQAIAMRRDLRSLSSLLFFLQMSFIASIFSSSGALVWCYVNTIDSTALLAIWQGWWLGSFLQSVLLVGPLMALLWPRISQWQLRRLELLHELSSHNRYYVLRLLALVSAGVLIYGFVTLQLTNSQMAAARHQGEAALLHASIIMQQTTWVFYSVFSVMVVFIAFFGYVLFTHWQSATNKLLTELHRANLNLKVLAHTDGLTGLLNRRTLEEYLHHEWQRSQRLGTSTALIMLDIDHFKDINDHYGHPTGDAVIRSLAQCIKSVAREIDITGRFGGEEFIIALPQTQMRGAWAFAERLRKQVQETRVDYEGQQLQFTISLGIAMFSASDSRYEHWLERADKALYRAKHQGRNQTALA